MPESTEIIYNRLSTALNRWTSPDMDVRQDPAAEAIREAIRKIYGLADLRALRDRKPLLRDLTGHDLVAIAKCAAENGWPTPSVRVGLEDLAKYIGLEQEYAILCAENAIQAKQVVQRFSIQVDRISKKGIRTLRYFEGVVVELHENVFRIGFSRKRDPLNSAVVDFPTSLIRSCDKKHVALHDRVTWRLGHWEGFGYFSYARIKGEE